MLADLGGANVTLLGWGYYTPQGETGEVGLLRA